MKIIADTNIPFVKECFSEIGEVQLYGGRQVTSQIVKDADILLVRSITKVNAELLEGSSVKFVGTATIGTDHVDTAYLEKKNIGFASAPGSNANSVAEYVVAALLCVCRKHKIKIAGKTMGIIGVGNVGSRVARKAQALGMHVMLNDPPLQETSGDDELYRPLEDILGCDFVTIHTPLERQGKYPTYHLAEESFFKKLKNGCVFLNTSRGAVTQTEALKNAIKSKKVSAAILDVWENEPNVDEELLRMVDVGTPHIAGYSFDGKVAGMTMLYEEVCRFLKMQCISGAEDFLPEPEVKEIDLAQMAGDEQEIIHETVQRVYPICRDDFNMREILMVPKESRGKFFDDLRKNYPVRREFRNTVVKMDGFKDGLKDKIKGIGFRVD